MEFLYRLIGKKVETDSIASGKAVEIGVADNSGDLHSEEAAGEYKSANLPPITSQAESLVEVLGELKSSADKAAEEVVKEVAEEVRDALKDNLVGVVEEKEKTREDIALEITAQFEGAGWGGVAGNFDGQGISAGVLQWNFGQGTLQKLLGHYVKINGPIEGFPRDINHFKDASKEEAVRMSAIMQGDRHRVLPLWKEAWKGLLTSDAGREAQTIMSAPYLQRAERMLESSGLTSTKAFCFFFDIAVQNGSLKGVGLPDYEISDNYIENIIHNSGDNQDVWKGMDLDDETKKLLVVARERANKSHSKWRMDVFSRKATIAVGKGIVHRSMRDFRDLLA